MEIEVGEYVRTNEGYIGKLVNKNEQWVNPLEIDIKREVRKDEFPKTHLYLDYNDIVKHRKNIIDLIEVGDVISYRIDNISTTLETKGYIEGIVDIADNEMLQEIKENKDYCIKSILTREQFAQAEYKIKEDK